MQLFALENNVPIHASQAVKQKNYYCLECNGIVRARGGLHKQRHFYHLNPNRSCSLHQKGMIHLQLQMHLYQQLPQGDCQLEFRMPSIGRIADVVWTSQKIVYEIQCSPITAEEVKSRNSDYSKLGWTVVWILHDQRFNQWRMTAAEQHLRFSPHYFTNFDKEGDGQIYDQFDHLAKGLRLHKLSPLKVDLTQPRFFGEVKLSEFSLKIVHERSLRSPLFFKGDLSDKQVLGEEIAYINTALQKEKDFFEKKKVKSFFSFGHFIQFFFERLFFRPYYFLFRILLEKICR